MKSTWSKLHLTLKIGLIVFVLGAGPLLILLGLDVLGLIDAGNAVGPGIVAMLSFYPSIILILIGSILTVPIALTKSVFSTDLFFNIKFSIYISEILRLSNLVKQ